MKIIQLKAENFLRLRAVQIDPKGEVIKISGANGEGKTSTLDAIWAALDHRRLNATEPVHKGAKKAVIRLDLGEIVVTRTITSKSTELTIHAPDGSKIASPQRFLDALVGELSFDPLAFDRMKPAEQVDMLRRAVKVNFDFAEATRENARDYDRRTDINRRAKALRTTAEGMRQDTPREPADEAPTLQRIQEATDHNAKIEERRLKRQSLRQHADTYEAQAKRVAERIAKLREELADAEKDMAECQEQAKIASERLAAAPALPEPIDVSAELEQLQRIREHNRLVALGQERARVIKEADSLEAEAERLTASMEAREAAKRAAIASAQLPIESLDLKEDGVYYKGWPYLQASAAERLRISMAIAMAANPKIRVIRISDGSLLDSKSMAIVGEMAKENDFQVWVEVVDESKKVGIVIEDGAVVAVNE